MSQTQQVQRSTGRVKRFTPSLGYGFIAPDDGSEDIFVHQSAIKSDGFRTLAKNEEVEFFITIGENQKFQAIDVTGPNGASVLGSKRDRAVCYNCHGVGHIARDCPSPENVGRRGGRAAGGRYNSGEGREMSNGGGCYNCGKEGHFSRDCQEERRSGGGCYTCGEEGHLSRDCPERRSGGGCYNCRQEGHLSRDCPEERSSGGGCYNCGKQGHMARDCAQKSSNCYNCKKSGHFARDCPVAYA